MHKGAEERHPCAYAMDITGGGMATHGFVQPTRPRLVLKGQGHARQHQTKETYNQQKMSYSVK